MNQSKSHIISFDVSDLKELDEVKQLLKRYKQDDVIIKHVREYDIYMKG